MDRSDEFSHAALLYRGEDEFLAGTVPFLRDILAMGGSALVAVSAAKISMLRNEVEGEGERVRFVDMASMGRNPARIIPVWRDFVAENVGAGRAFGGIGEPVWPGRDGPELDECLRHESLLNLAFDGGAPWRLLCPYDADRLPDEVLADAHRSHPIVETQGTPRASEAYEPELAVRALAGELTEPPAGADAVAFSRDTIGSVRRFAADHALLAGLDRWRAEDVELAVNELAANSLRHGGGRGTAHIWLEPSAVVCEVRDSGRISDPLTGRLRPDDLQLEGRGLWIVNQLCDLVQIRSHPGGSVVRIRMSLS